MFRRKKKESAKAFDVLLDYISDVQKDFLESEHGFTYEYLSDKKGHKLCEECGYKFACSSGIFPDCLASLVKN